MIIKWYVYMLMLVWLEVLCYFVLEINIKKDRFM